MANAGRLFGIAIVLAAAVQAWAAAPGPSLDPESAQSHVGSASVAGIAMDVWNIGEEAGFDLVQDGFGVAVRCVCDPPREGTAVVAAGLISQFGGRTILFADHVTWTS